MRAIGNLFRVARLWITRVASSRVEHRRVSHLRQISVQRDHCPQLVPWPRIPASSQAQKVKMGPSRLRGAQRFCPILFRNARTEILQCTDQILAVHGKSLAVHGKKSCSARSDQNCAVHEPKLCSAQIWFCILYSTKRKVAFVKNPLFLHFPSL